VWVTDGGRNEVQRINPYTLEVTRYPIPGPNVNLNTATIDVNGTVWFTGQAGYYGRVDPINGEVELFEAPRGPGPYGIDATPEGRQVWFVSLAGSYLAQIDLETGVATVHEPPTAGAGLRRVWSDSRGRLWVSEWYAGQLGMYDPALDEWREWHLPGADPQPYSVFVDARDLVWLTDFASNSIVRFDPATETFESFAIPTPGANIRQQLGFYEVWGAESATDKLIVTRVRLP
jgi:virginiamycin B lyase